MNKNADTMNRKMSKAWIASIIGVFLLAALVIGVSAYGPGAQLGQKQTGQGQSGQGARASEAGNSAGVTCQYHDQMQQVLATGTYADLVKLRTESGKPMMPFVTDEQTFQQAQEQHKQMIAQYGDNSQAGTGCGMMGGHKGQGMRQGLTRGQGCPMADGDE